MKSGMSNQNLLAGGGRSVDARQTLCLFVVFTINPTSRVAGRILCDPVNFKLLFGNKVWQLFWRGAAMTEIAVLIFSPVISLLFALLLFLVLKPFTKDDPPEDSL